jgi:hypothetical protein
MTGEEEKKRKKGGRPGLGAPLNLRGEALALVGRAGALLSMREGERSEAPGEDQK